MRPLLPQLLLALALISPLVRGAAPASTTAGPGPGAPIKAAPPDPVWEARLPSFDEATYDRIVEKMISDYEQESHRKLAPGAKKKAGIKIYADSGPGLATPLPLVKAVINSLKRRGFANQNIFLVGLNALRLRMTGYLP